MEDKKIIQQLAVERCRMHLSHICALMHLSETERKNRDFIGDNLYILFERLNKDFGLIEEILTTGDNSGKLV